MATPKRLRRPPLLEVLFEVRFAGKQEAIGDLLPGMVFSHLGHRYSKVEPLPMAQIPREMRIGDPSLKYQPHVRLAADSDALLLGDHIATLSKSPPHTGWPDFRVACNEVVTALRSTRLIHTVQRFSLKCINLLPITAGQYALDSLNAILTLDGHSATNSGLRVRAEISASPFTNVIDLAATVTAETAQGELKGLLFSLDTIHPAPPTDFWETPLDLLDSAHETIKGLFFSLLKEETIRSFEPEWGDQ